MKVFKSNSAREKTVVQEYLENEEIKRKISPEIQIIINGIPKETIQQLLDLFHNDKLSLYSTIQKFFSKGIENIDTIVSILMYRIHELTFGEQLILSRLIEYNYLPEEAKKEFMLMGFSKEKVNILTEAFSNLKYGKQQQSSQNKTSLSHYKDEYPGDFIDL